MYNCYRKKELRQNNTGQETVSENGICFNTSSSDTARFRAVSVPSYWRLFQPQPTHISFERHQSLLSPKTVSFSPIFHKAPTVAILAQAVTQKRAHPHTRSDACVVESQSRPENFHNSLLKTKIPAALFSEPQREPTLQVQFLYRRDLQNCQRMRAGIFGRFQ